MTNLYHGQLMLIHYAILRRPMRGSNLKTLIFTNQETRVSHHKGETLNITQPPSSVFYMFQPFKNNNFRLDIKLPTL